MRSEIDVSGVASFSPNRSLRCTHAMGVLSPSAANKSRACRETGLYGSSLISLPATMGIHSSSKSVSERIMRVFACPRSPRNTTSCPASSAFSNCGITVCSYPITPSNSGRPAEILRTAFLRNSSLMGRDSQPEARRAPRVVGRDSGTGGIVIYATVPREP